MNDEIRLRDEILLTIGAAFANTSKLMSEGTRARVSSRLPSISGIGGEVAAYLEAVSVARAALADVAESGSHSVAELMQQSDALERYLVAELQPGFAVPYE